MDRTTVNIAKAQTGFIDFIVMPSFEILNNLFPGYTKSMENIKTNKEKWKS
jgi:hypothetical protein